MFLRFLCHFVGRNNPVLGLDSKFRASVPSVLLSSQINEVFEDFFETGPQKSRSCHCEERSDVAISSVWPTGLPRRLKAARNDTGE